MFNVLKDDFTRLEKKHAEAGVHEGQFVCR